MQLGNTGKVILSLYPQLVFSIWLVSVCNVTHYRQTLKWTDIS